MSDSLRPHGLQHARLPYPSPSPTACSNSCTLSLWCHQTISSSVAPFTSSLQSFPASGSFLMSQLFTSGGQRRYLYHLIFLTRPVNIQVSPSSMGLVRGVDKDTLSWVSLGCGGREASADGHCLCVGTKQQSREMCTPMYFWCISLEGEIAADTYLFFVFFPVVMYGCESWTIKKAECWRIDAFELWCWRRLLRVPWTARRSKQSILKETSPGCSLEGLMLKLKLQYFGHLMWRADSFEKTLMLGKTEGEEEDDRGWDGWMASPTQWTWIWVHSGSWWWTGRPGVLRFMGWVTKGWTQLSNWTEPNVFLYQLDLGVTSMEYLTIRKIK